MSLYLRQQDTRSDLQEKLSKDLQERAKQKAKTFDQPDGVTDSRYVENTKQTSSLAWLWAVVFVAVIGLIVWFIVSTL